MEGISAGLSPFLYGPDKTGESASQTCSSFVFAQGLVHLLHGDGDGVRSATNADRDLYGIAGRCVNRNLHIHLIEAHESWRQA